MVRQAVQSNAHSSAQCSGSGVDRLDKDSKAGRANQSPRGSSQPPIAGSFIYGGALQLPGRILLDRFS